MSPGTPHTSRTPHTNADGDQVDDTILDGPVLPATPYDYSATSISSNEMVTLGRVLFYDRSLSLNNTVACASCHKQVTSFADNGQFSQGYLGDATLRNSMPIHNLNLTINLTDSIASVYGSSNSDPTLSLGGLFWDGRQSDLKTMVLQPMINKIEMGNASLGDVQVRIVSRRYYQKLFNDAFGSSQIISMDQVSTALAAFVMSLKISNTKFDQYNTRIKTNTPVNDILSDVEIKGMQLFQGKYNCNSCHHIEEVNMTPRFANIGLEINYADVGLMKITGSIKDEGKFLVPSLRNIEFTAPYMHDGSIITLEKVLDHYSTGIITHADLHDDLRDENGNAKKMNIPDDEVAAIITFLKTLSDKSILTDPKFSDPFQR